MSVYLRGIVMALAGIAFTFSSALADNLEDGKLAYDTGKYEKAFELLFPLAHEGDMTAQSLVGSMLKEGQGAAQNVDEARKWFAFASEQGDKFAQFNLAVMMYNGEGGPRDDLAAYKWMLLSYKSGNKLAGRRLAHVISKLTKAERKQVEGEVENWKPGEKRPVSDDSEEAPPKKEPKLFAD